MKFGAIRTGAGFTLVFTTTSGGTAKSTARRYCVCASKIIRYEDLDKQGVIRHVRVGEGGCQEKEQLIQSLLAETF
jgi:hypothetical protein